MVNMQPTSLEVYFNKVIPNITRRQNEVLEIFFENPNMTYTNQELARELKWSINRVTPRTLELRSMGILKWGNTRVDKVTNNNAKEMRVNI